MFKFLCSKFIELSEFQYALILKMCPQTHYTINVNFMVETLRHAQVDKLGPVCAAHKPDFTGAVSCHRPVTSR